MAKATTKLSAQDRVILFCAATGIDHAAVGITARHGGAFVIETLFPRQQRLAFGSSVPHKHRC